MEHDQKYNNVVMAFYYYYKYTFHFKGTAADGSKVFASIGGDSGDTYRFEVDTGKTYLLGGGVDGFKFENVTVTQPEESNPQDQRAGHPAPMHPVVGRTSLLEQQS